MNGLPVGGILLVSIFWNFAASSALAACGEPSLQERSVIFEVVAQGLVYPWSLAFLPTGDMLVTERPGRLRVVRKGVLLDDSIHGLPHLVNLFDVAVHPDFVDNQLLYLAYSARDADAVGLEVVRARLLENRLVDTNVIFRATPKDSVPQFSGGRLLFISGSELLITIGDRQDGLSSGHDPSNHFGKVVRVTDSGLPPDDSYHKGKRLPEVHTFGHRNVQGIALDIKTNEVWISEHGPVGGDELNVLRAGGNYGWPIEHFGEAEDSSIPAGATSQPPFEKPVLTWTPAIGPSGLAIYRGEKFPEWSGSMFIGSLLGCVVIHVRLGDDGQVVSEENLLGELGERIRDVRVGPDEVVYILTDEIDGKLISIAPLHQNTLNPPRNSLAGSQTHAYLKQM